jgi:TetR/AcrR family transcriptional repressor of nem operon
MGRPRNFDEEKVLSAFVEAFWAKGYERTSTRDLVECAGLSQSSLYNAFGDKRSIYRRSLDHYLTCSVRARIRRLEAVSDAGAAISLFFSEVLERTLSDPLHRGCLLVNSFFEISENDCLLSDAVKNELEVITSFFISRLEKANSAGISDSKSTSAEGASLLVSVLVGVRGLAKSRPDPQMLIQAFEYALKLLGLPGLSKLDYKF